MKTRSSIVLKVSLLLCAQGVWGCYPGDELWSHREDQLQSGVNFTRPFNPQNQPYEAIPGVCTPRPDTDPNLWPMRILLSQGVDVGLYPQEDLGAVTVPRIAGRETIVRAFIGITGAEGAIQDVGAQLHGELEGTPLPGSPLYATLETVADPPSTSDWTHSLNFRLPESWTVPGASFYLMLDPDNQIPEADESDNRAPASGTQEFGFEKARAFNLVIVPVIHEERSPDPAAYREIEEWIRGTYPVPYVDVEIHAPVTYTGAPVAPNGENWDDMLNFLTALQGAETSRPDLYYYGLFNPGYEEGVHGLAWVPYSPSSPYPIAVGTDRSPRAGKTAAHEIGHNHGRRHVDACGTPSGIDPTYPYPGGGIGVTGWRPGTATLFDSAAYADLMSYCDDVWVSDFNYLAFYNWDASLDRATRSRGPAPAERVFFVSGGIEAGRVSNLRAFDLPDQFETPDQGDHRLELLDADGNLVAARRFATARTDRFPGSSGFSVKIDRSGLEVEGYRIVGPGEQLLLEERRSGTHPRVEIQSAELTAQRTRRIAWREDGDRELLRVVMVYAEPSGRWEIRSFGGEQTSYEWKELDEETRPLHVRVIVSDGVRSDTADAAF